MNAGRGATAVGIAYAAAAYGLWGLFPLYFRALRGVPPTQVLAHRVVWSVLFLAAVLTLRRGWSALAPEVVRPRLLRFVVTGLMLSSNWLLYIWAVGSGHTLDASLGYFVTPLVNVVLGVLVLKERLSRAQIAAVALATLGVAAQVVAIGRLPWVALSLAATFGLYGLVRKGLDVPSTPALLMETLLMLPFAAAWLVWQGADGTLAFARGDTVADALLLGAGVVTSVPLLFFGEGARRLPLTTLGVLQYLSPTGQFLLAVYAFGEPFTAAHGVSFVLIWAGLVVYTTEVVRRYAAAA